MVGSLICNTKEVSGQCGGRWLNGRDLVQSLNVFGWKMMKKENEEGGWKNHSSGIGVTHKVVFLDKPIS